MPEGKRGLSFSGRARVDTTKGSAEMRCTTGKRIATKRPVVPGHGSPVQHGIYTIPAKLENEQNVKMS